MKKMIRAIDKRMKSIFYGIQRNQCLERAREMVAASIPYNPCNAHLKRAQLELMKNYNLFRSQSLRIT